MKVQIFTEHLDRIHKLNDNEKVFMGLLTFLHHKYPGTNLFRLYSHDFRVILNEKAVGAVKFNKDVFVVGRLAKKAIFFGLGEVKDLNDMTYIDIEETTACTTQGYLIALYKLKTDWLEVTQHKLTTYHNTDNTFTVEERDIFFKTPENRVAIDHGFRRTD